MEIGMNMSISVKCSNSQHSVGPQKHDSDQSQPIQAKMDWIQIDVIFEISCDRVLWIDDFTDKRLVNTAGDAQDTQEQTIELIFCDFDTILKVIDDKDKNRRKETDCVNNGKRKIKLSHSDCHTLNCHGDISFEHVFKVEIVLEVHTHIVISSNYYVDQHESKASEN